MFLSVALMVAGCGTARHEAVVVNITDGPGQGGRFRSSERQRDVWIAPQTVDNEVLQHEQLVTFIEKPQTWQLPSTMEPHAVPSPQLPLQEGEYDVEVVRRQKEMILQNQADLKKLAEKIELLKGQSQQEIEHRDSKLNETLSSLQATQQQLSAAKQKLADIEAAEKLKQEEEAKRKAAPFWKKLW